MKSGAAYTLSNWLSMYCGVLCELSLIAIAYHVARMEKDRFCETNIDWSARPPYPALPALSLLSSSRVSCRLVFASAILSVALCA